MIAYHSTRAGEGRCPFSQALLAGIAPDGGLFVPERLPVITPAWMDGGRGRTYQEIATRVLGLFETDLPEQSLRDSVLSAYGSAWDHPRIAPLSQLHERDFLLELWHGPTCAFKDLALQLMPQLFSRASRSNLAENGQSLRHLILVATSGDTGKAALEGYRDVEGIDIAVYFPAHGVSPVQEMAMRTQEGANVLVKGVNGDFDAVQSAVKQVFSDQFFSSYLRERFSVQLSSANSINWGRLLPQLVYYVSAYLDLMEQNGLKTGDEVDVVVPSGNFGNLLSAFLVKQMGLPLGRLICASNQNNVLTDFLRTGVYDIRERTLQKTCSPSMDILIASNIERLLYFITSDPERTAVWMRELRDQRMFQIDQETLNTVQLHFSAGWVGDDEALKKIKSTFAETNRLIDPHTAVALCVADQHRQVSGSTRPAIICSTAHWAKFPGAVLRAVDEGSFQKHVEGRDEFQMLDLIAELTGQEVPALLRCLNYLPVRFTSTVRADVAEIKHGIDHYLSARYGKREKVL